MVKTRVGTGKVAVKTDSHCREQTIVRECEREVWKVGELFKAISWDLIACWSTDGTDDLVAVSGKRGGERKGERKGRKRILTSISGR